MIGEMIKIPLLQKIELKENKKSYNLFFSSFVTYHRHLMGERGRSFIVLERLGFVTYHHHLMWEREKVVLLF
ncbi:hypothetical protein HanIR_Chr06g0288171 [Helianthus annuus]|nr:hypothetical protein HanIR_Chr06g0288171 [Helianthus annuus]